MFTHYYSVVHSTHFFLSGPARQQGSRPPTWRSRRGQGGIANTGRPAQGRGRKLPRRRPRRAPSHRGHVGGPTFLVLLAGLGRPDARILPGATGKQHGPRPLQAGPHGSILVHPRPPSHPPRPKAPPAAFSSRHPPASRAGLSPVPSVCHGLGRRSRSPPRPAGARPCSSARPPPPPARYSRPGAAAAFSSRPCLTSKRPPQDSRWQCVDVRAARICGLQAPREITGARGDCRRPGMSRNIPGYPPERT